MKLVNNKWKAQIPTGNLHRLIVKLGLKCGQPFWSLSWTWPFLCHTFNQPYGRNGLINCHKMLRFLSFCGWLSLTFKIKFNLEINIYPILTCPHHNSSPIQFRITQFVLEGQNTLIKIPIVLGAIYLDLQDQIQFQKSQFLITPLKEMHNHHKNTREPQIPRLLRKPDLFHDLHPLHIHLLIYLDLFTTLTVSQSQTTARTIYWSTCVGSWGYFSI